MYLCCIIVLIIYMLYRFVIFAAVRIVLRGKAHAEWQVLVSGDRSAVKDDQYFIDNRSLIFGKGL